MSTTEKACKESPADRGMISAGKPIATVVATKNPGPSNMEADGLQGSAEQEPDKLHIPTVNSHAKSNGITSRLEPSASNKYFKRTSKGTTSKSPRKQEADKMTIKAGSHGARDSSKQEKKDVSGSSNGGILKSSPSPKVNVEMQKKSLPKVAKIMDSQTMADTHKLMTEANAPSKPIFSNVKSLTLSLNADPQVAMPPPIKTMRMVKGSAPAHKDGSPANLCTQCRAEALEGAVCFIGNDGRVSACTSRNAVRLCKNLRCANNNPEYVASVAAVNAGPKKYLVSRRHSLNLPRSSPSGKGGSAIGKLHAGSSDENGSSSSHSRRGMVTTPMGDKGHELDEQEEREHEDASSGADDLASPSPHNTDSHGIGGPSGSRRTRRASFSVLETQGPEVVTLRKQMLQERKNAEEWRLDYAIEEALHRLAPAKDSRVKALVEAFESINVPQNATSEVGVHH